MANFESLESAREFFYKDKFAVMTGVTLDEITEDEAICSLELTDDYQVKFNFGPKVEAIVPLEDLQKNPCLGECPICKGKNYNIRVGLLRRSTGEVSASVV